MDQSSTDGWNVHLMTIVDVNINNNRTSYYNSNHQHLANGLEEDASTTMSSSSSTSSSAGYSLTETILISAVLLFIIVGTVVGNILVCVAVCLVRRLRRPCNYLLVSLAVSDLCVALLVMPMALVYEVLGTWPFGARACDTWVAFDVLSCTASILNLCMISVDRYWAITRPLDYGVKRTPARMISCVALVWISSACISLPPLLVLGNEHGPSPLNFPVNNNNVSHHQPTAADGPATTTTTTSNWIELLVTKTTSDDSAGLQDYQCQVCQEFGYQIYATLGSFYIPLAVMAAVYYQIFQAAKRIVDEEKKAQSHLLMTRTNSSCTTTTKQKTTTTTTTTTASSPPPPGQQQQKATSSSLLVHPAHRHHPPVSCNSAAMVVVRRHSDRQVNEERNSNKETNSSLPETNNSPPSLSHNESSWTNNCNGNNYPVTTHWPDNHSKPQQQQQQQPKTVDISRNSLSVSMDNVTGETTIPVVLSHPIDAALSYVEQQKQPGVLIHQSGLNPLPMRHRRNRSHRLTHGRASRVRLRFALNKERKASTTLGIIMSAFTLCWFPFFVLALVRPFMSHQTASLVIPHWLSSLFLWLGYANSFLNPVIYATTNKDFRLPFREILCLRCKSLNSVMREDFYQSQYGNNQQLMGNNNKGGLMATGGHPSPSSHAKLQGGHNHKSRRRRRYSTDCLADDDEQQNERIISHQQEQQPNASAISKVDASVSATGDEEEDTVTDYGLMSSGHRISSSSATAFL